MGPLPLVPDGIRYSNLPKDRPTMARLCHSLTFCATHQSHKDTNLCSMRSWASRSALSVLESAITLYSKMKASGTAPSKI